jgi:uncharacterized phage-associated protein
MANANDVAAYILSKTGTLTTMKLQKLVYYTQAWSLVGDEAPMFNERIEAWANGPVVPELYRHHRGIFQVSSWSHGDASQLDSTEKETVDAVLRFYGDKPSQWLSDLTHREDPWADARKGVDDGTPCKSEITHASMAEYYGSLAYDCSRETSNRLLSRCRQKRRSCHGLGSDPSNFYKQKPSWRIRRLEFKTPWGWHELGKEQLHDIRSKLGDFEGRTWSEILVESKKQNHSVSIDGICKAARDRLDELELGDLESLVSLRLIGKQRVWGILNEGVLTLLWWDPDHTVYPVELRNT